MISLVLKLLKINISPFICSKTLINSIMKLTLLYIGNEVLYQYWIWKANVAIYVFPGILLQFSRIWWVVFIYNGDASDEMLFPFHERLIIKPFETLFECAGVVSGLSTFVKIRTDLLHLSLIEPLDSRREFPNKSHTVLSQALNWNNPNLTCVF